MLSRSGKKKAPKSLERFDTWPSLQGFLKLYWPDNGRNGFGEKQTCDLCNINKEKKRAKEKMGKRAFQKKETGKIGGFWGKGQSVCIDFLQKPYILNRKKYSTSAKKYATIKHNSNLHSQREELGKACRPADW